ncbi:AGR3 protein, partial [Alcedo cyanopectus]|nr:AGR3 protein [Ceyx cyanopectus]
IMLHSTLALSLLLIAVSSNLAMAIKKEKRAPQTLSRGWGDEITWVQTYEEGLYQAKKRKEECGQSLATVVPEAGGGAGFEMDFKMIMSFLALKKAFAENEELQEMAQNNFVMLNLMHETTDKNLSPDGQYVPRIMFIDPSLTVRADITGRYSNRLYTYEPQDIPFLIENMKKALRLIQTEL